MYILREYFAVDNHLTLITCEIQSYTVPKVRLYSNKTPALLPSL